MKKSFIFWNFIVAVILFMTTIIINKYIVFSSIVLSSSIGIFVYHYFIKRKELKTKESYSVLFITFLFCLLISLFLYFTVAYNVFLISSGTIFIVGGITAILFNLQKNSR